jgi:hypothetical protein
MAMAKKDKALETKRASREVGDPLDPTRVRAALEVLYDMQTAYGEAVAQVKASGIMPQRLIAVAHTAAQVETVMQDVQKAFYERADAMRTKGRFEKGQLGVEFKLVSGRRNPQWKDEATRKAEELAKLKGKKFNAKRYQQRVLDSAPKSDDTFKPEIVVRED